MHVESLGIQTIPRDMDYMCILLFILYIYALSIFPLRIEILVVINFFSATLIIRLIQKLCKYNLFVCDMFYCCMHFHVYDNFLNKTNGQSFFPSRAGPEFHYQGNEIIKFQHQRKKNSS
jgi:hypothetical protein